MFNQFCDDVQRFLPPRNCSCSVFSARFVRFRRPLSLASKPVDLFVSKYISELCAFVNSVRDSAREHEIETDFYAIKPRYQTSRKKDSFSKDRSSRDPAGANRGLSELTEFVFANCCQLFNLLRRLLKIGLYGYCETEAFDSNFVKVVVPLSM